MVHEFCIHQLTWSCLQLKSPNGRRPPTLSLDCRSLQVVSSLPFICWYVSLGSCTSISSIMFMGIFSWGAQCNFPRLVWIDPATQGFGGQVLGVWYGCLTWDLMRWDVGNQTTWRMNQEALQCRWCESLYLGTWKLTRYLVPLKRNWGGYPCAQWQACASCIVEYRTIRGCHRLPIWDIDGYSSFEWFTLHRASFGSAIRWPFVVHWFHVTQETDTEPFSTADPQQSFELIFNMSPNCVFTRDISHVILPTRLVARTHGLIARSYEFFSPFFSHILTTLISGNSGWWNT